MESLNKELIKNLNSYDILINNYIVIDEPVRKHKRKRIQKKWIKRYGYHKVQDPRTMYFINDKLVMTERCYKIFKRYLEKENKNE